MLLSDRWRHERDPDQREGKVSSLTTVALAPRQQQQTHTGQHLRSLPLISWLAALLAEAHANAAGSGPITCLLLLRGKLLLSGAASKRREASFRVEVGTDCAQTISAGQQTGRPRQSRPFKWRLRRREHSGE